jgi:hypothetical protein
VKSHPFDYASLVDLAVEIWKTVCWLFKVDYFYLCNIFVPLIFIAT